MPKVSAPGGSVRLGSSGRDRLALVVAAGFNLLATGVIVADVAGLDAPDPVPALPIWLLIAAFTLVELAVVHLEIGGLPVVIVLRATPVLAGITYLSPTEVVAAHVIGTSAALLLRHRPSPSVAAIVVAWNAAGTALASIVVAALLPAWSGTGAGWWVVGCTAMIVANAAAAVGGLARWSPAGRPLRARPSLATLGYGSIASVVDVSLAISVVMYLRTDPSELLLLAGPALLALAGYRAWTGLRRRHARVEFLYTCARLLEGPSSGTAIFDDLLGLTREVVGAERAGLVLREAGDRRLGASVGPGTARHLLTVAIGNPLLGTEPLLDGAGAVLVRRGRPLPGSRLAVGATDAIVVQVSGGAGTCATLTVSGHRGGSRFTKEDLRLMEAVATSVGAAISSRRMAEELRASVADLAQLAALTAPVGTPRSAAPTDSPADERDLMAASSLPWSVPAGSAMALGIIDGQFTWQWVNDALCDLLGAAMDDLVGHRFEMLVLRDDIEAAHGLVSRMLRGESRGSAVEIRLRRGDTCDPIVASFLVRPMHSVGAPTRALCMLEDVTAARRAEERAARIERRVEEAILDLTAIRQPDAVLRALVDAARDVTDADLVAVVGGEVDQRSLLPLDEADAATLASLLGEPGHRAIRVPVPDTDGISLLVLRHAGVESFSADDEVVARRLAGQAGVSLRNAYAHERALELVRELDSANAALHEASAARSRFLANVSHELRTPLHAILITAQLMTDPSVATRDPERARGLPATVDRTGRHLLALIEDLVDLSRMELHDLRMNLVAMDLEAAVHDAAGQVSPLAEERGIDLTVASGEGTWVMGDPKRLRQVLVNLLANAVKYTERGGRVRLTVARDLDGLRLCVQDTGLGINPAELDRAFEPFERLVGTSIPGAGLGLPIARRIMELHGGALTATSVPGLGSVFTAHLPAEAVLVGGRPSPAVAVPSASRTRDATRAVA